MLLVGLGKNLATLKRSLDRKGGIYAYYIIIIKNLAFPQKNTRLTKLDITELYHKKPASKRPAGGN